MTADRDELAKVIEDWLCESTNHYHEDLYAGPWNDGTGQVRVDGNLNPSGLADAILAAGWRAPEPPHRHQWAVAGFGTAVTGHPVAPRWSCPCGALKYGTVGDADDYKQARGAAKLDRPAEEIIREGRGE